MDGYAIGNGNSRRGFDLRALYGRGKIVVCNSAYTEIIPDYVVALDRPMVAEIERIAGRKFGLIARDHRLGMSVDGHTVLSRSQINEYYDNLSGIWACVYLAKVVRCENVYMLGYDFYLSEIEPKPTKKKKTSKKKRLLLDEIYDVDEHTESEAIHETIDPPRPEYMPRVAEGFNRLAAACPQTTFYRVGQISEHHAAFFADELKGYQYIDYGDLP